MVVDICLGNRNLTIRSSRSHIRELVILTHIEWDINLKILFQTCKLCSRKGCAAIGNGCQFWHIGCDRFVCDRQCRTPCVVNITVVSVILELNGMLCPSQYIGMGYLRSLSMFRTRNLNRSRNRAKSLKFYDTIHNGRECYSGMLVNLTTVIV